MKKVISIVGIVLLAMGHLLIDGMDVAKKIEKMRKNDEES